MNITAEVIDGTLKPDGTLELDQKPSLVPGRVKVALQSAPATAPRRGLADTIDAVHRSQQAAGRQGRSAAEIDASLREGEAEYEQSIQELRLPVQESAPTEDD